MDAAAEMLDIVDENDVIVGQATRADIHARGLRHREINVLFITPDGQAIFQRRAGGLLDAAVGGHVEIGQSYLDAAIMEVSEETGLDILAADLLPLGKITYDEHFPNGSKPYNKGFRMVFAYVYRGKIEDLKIEEGKGAGFEVCPIDAMYQAGPPLDNVNPCLRMPDYLAFYRQLVTLAAA